MTDKNITTIRVSIDFWNLVKKHQKHGETREQTLRRLIKEGAKDE